MLPLRIRELYRPMWSKFQEESPQIERLELRLLEGQELKEDQTVP